MYYKSAASTAEPALRINLYVTTSDWYNPMLPAFAHLFNLHWSRDQPVSYLNVYSKGRVNWGELGRLRGDLLDELFRLELIGPSWNGWEPPPETSDRSRLPGLA